MSAMAPARDGIGTTGGGKKIVSGLLAGLLVAAALVAAVYGVAATAATTIAASFNPAEMSRHSRSVEFETAVKRGVDEYRTARAKCELVASAKRRACYSAAAKRPTLKSASNDAPAQW